MNVDLWTCVALLVDDLRPLACVNSDTRRAVTGVVDVLSHRGTFRLINVPFSLYIGSGLVEERRIYLQLGTGGRVAFFFHSLDACLRLESISLDCFGAQTHIPCSMAGWLTQTDVVLQNIGSMVEFARTACDAPREVVIHRLLKYRHIYQAIHYSL